MGAYEQARADLLRHEQVTDHVREKVYSKEWGVDGPIPSENELASMLGVSRGTVHKGIQALVDEGLLVSHRGRGTFAARPLMARPSNTKLVSFAESMDEQDIPYTTKVIEKRVERANEICASKLEISPECEYLYLTRVRSVRGRPVMFLESHLNMQACPGIESADFEQESVFSAVERTSKRAVGHSQMTYSACVAGKARGEWLECNERTPVLNVDQLVRLEDQTPFEWGSVWLPANRCVLSSETSRKNVKRG